MNALEPIQRVSIAHKLKNLSQSADSFFLSVEKLADMMKDCKALPIPVQVKNIILYIGNENGKMGIPLKGLPDGFYVIIGAQDFNAAKFLLKRLGDEELISFERSFGEGYNAFDIELTLKGWEQFESYKSRFKQQC